MSRDLRFAFLVLILLILSVGCRRFSHNPAVFTFGKKISVGTAEYGELSYLDGIAIVDVSRENSSWSIEIDETTGITIDKDAGSLKGIKKITRTIGRQVTGYLVDLAETDAAAAESWCKGGDARQGE